MIKAILIDADGVALKPRKRLSSKIYAEKYHIPYEKIDPFFRQEFQLCLLGKADLKKEIASYVAEWGEGHTVDIFLAEWFLQENVPEERVLRLVKKLGEKVPIYLASDQEKYRASYIWREMEFKEYFQKSFFSCHIGYSKHDKEFFEEILRELGVAPSEIMFWDDDPKNIVVAKELGIDAYLYEDYDEFEKILNFLL